jgi:hypothetical protein
MSKRSTAELVASIQESLDIIKKTLDPNGEFIKEYDNVFEEFTEEMADQMMMDELNAMMASDNKKKNKK